MEKKHALLSLLSAVIINFGITAQAEQLSRGIVAIHKSSGGNLISWRLQNIDPKGVTFNLMRDGKAIAQGLTTTNYTDANGTDKHKYQVEVIHDGNTIDISHEAQTWSNVYKTMKLDRPAKSFTPDGQEVTYHAFEASTADVDNDGELEILVKWNDNHVKDNAHDGYTGECIMDCYRLNPYIGNEDKPERLWRINLGKNIRTGSHYTQFLFYDFNGDGRAELICKTAPGSVDGLGRYVTEAATDEKIKAHDNTADYRTKAGRIMSGPEYLTVFDGLTGKAIHTIWYNPNRGFTTGTASGYSSWGDDYGNRGERYLACAAHLDGEDKPATAVMCRGYYTRSYLWAVDFDGNSLKQRWLHGSINKTRVEVTDASGKKTVTNYSSNTSGKGDNYTAYGQGCHSIAVGDVDGDGCDEIMYGAAAIDDDGSLMYTTGLGHGDAHHLGDFMPDRPGLEFMMPHEDAGNGWHVRDAATGELLIWKTAEGDNGRGMAGDIDLNSRGAEFWSAADYSVYDISGNILSTDHRPAYCFRIYWDGTLAENLLDGPKIERYLGNGNERLYTAEKTITNGSKAYPVLSADLFGDWREEVIHCSSKDSCTLQIYTSPYSTKFSVPTLMSDHLYRMSIVWQNVAYNQPPHLSYYLPDLFATRFIAEEGSSKEQTVTLGDSITPIVCRLKNCTSATAYATYLNGEKIKSFGVPTGFKFTVDRTNLMFTLTGTPDQLGTYEFVIRSSGNFADANHEDTLRVIVTEINGIHDITTSQPHTSTSIYDLQGRRIAPQNLKKGIYIINGRKVVIKQ